MSNATRPAATLRRDSVNENSFAATFTTSAFRAWAADELRARGAGGAERQEEKRNRRDGSGCHSCLLPLLCSFAVEPRDGGCVPIPRGCPRGARTPILRTDEPRDRP